MSIKNTIFNVLDVVIKQFLSFSNIEHQANLFYAGRRFGTNSQGAGKPAERHAVGMGSRLSSYVSCQLD